jgi:hypothetical protein
MRLSQREENAAIPQCNWWAKLVLGIHWKRMTRGSFFTVNVATLALRPLLKIGELQPNFGPLALAGMPGRHLDRCLGLIQIELLVNREEISASFWLAAFSRSLSPFS